MRKHSSRSHRSKEPRVTFSIPEEDYDIRGVQENVPPNNDFNLDSRKPQKSSTTSLASKFSKRWEHVYTDDSPRFNYQCQEETPKPRISKAQPEISEEEILDSPVCPKLYNNYDDVPEVELSPKLYNNYDDVPEDDMSDDLPRKISAYRNPSNQSAEAILQNIDVLVNRVREICNKK